MTNEFPQPTFESQLEMAPSISSEPKPDTPTILPDAITSQKNNEKKHWTILGITFGGLACFLLIVVFAIVSILINIGKEKASITKVLDSYMYAMKVKNPERAYEFFSPRAARQVPISRLQEWIEGKNYGYFEGYQSLIVDTFSIAAVLKRNPNQPQGIVYTIKGTISYEGSIHGSLNSTLEKVNGEWKIFDVTVIAPLDKLK